MNPLINATDLSARLAADTPTTLLDVRWVLNGPSQRSIYEQGHLPGAVWIDLKVSLSGPPGAGGRHPLPSKEVFGNAMVAAGVRHDVPVVVYDQNSSLAAARLWWLLTDAGHSGVQVLDGGYDVWLATGGEIETGWRTVDVPGDFTPTPGLRRRVSAAEVEAIVAGRAAGQPDCPRLIDVRAADRFAGENETIDPVAGHIPGAINRPSTDNLTASGFRSAAEISARYGATSTDDTVLYCGSGTTAAQTLLALESAGQTAAIYPGSWSDWITDPSRPVETGAGSEESTDSFGQG